MNPTRQYDLDFRKEEVDYVMRHVAGSISCSLVGIGSVGKSNLLQHLTDPNVHAHYLGEDAAKKLKTITIDANMLGPLPPDKDDPMRCWAGYELMMHRLYLAFYPFDMLSETEAQRFYETYLALQNGTNPLYTYMALRYFEVGLQYFLRQGYKIAFLFDEFDEMLKQLPVKFYQTLRGIRDSNKRSLIYITFTRSPLPALVERDAIPMLDIEPFIELFTDNVYYVGPYNEKDARKMYDELSSRRQRIFPDSVRELLLQATGRYAGLIRAGFASLEEMSGLDQATESLDTLAEALASRSAVRTECKTIWTSLKSLGAVRAEGGRAADALQRQHGNRAGGHHAGAEAAAAAGQNSAAAGNSAARVPGVRGIQPRPGMSDGYLIPAQRHRVTTSVSNSRFITTIGRVTTVDEAKAMLAAVRAEMPDASHHVYAYRVGFGNSVIEGMSDDGEPSGTSGPPILAVLRGSGIGDVLVVVTRYFGGTKLGTGGLVRAYGDAARAGLSTLPTERKIEKQQIGMDIPYHFYEQVKRLITQHEGTLDEETFAGEVTLLASFPVDQVAEFSAALVELTAGSVRPINL